MRRLEALGLSRGQAEALTQHLTTILCQNKEKLEEFFASKVALEKVRAAALRCAAGTVLVRPPRLARSWSAASRSHTGAHASCP